jgi:hypothetical protein
MRRFFVNLTLFVVSTLVAIVGCELGLRYLFPRAALGSGVELTFFRDQRAKWMSVLMVPDKEIGFRPKPNTEGGYDNYGLLRRSHNDAFAARHRILFIGDSVTARSRIVNAIQKDLNDPTTEFLNGGVESFNLAQEVNFFLRFQSALRVDRIIHQVHGNDLQATPIVFRDETGILNAYRLNAPKQYVNEWLFQISYLYRLGLAVFLSQGMESHSFLDARDDFSKMATFAVSHGIRYDVVLFPILSPQPALPPEERRDWDILERACREVVSHCVSLLPVLNQMLAEGQPPEETAGDSWHPNDNFANLAATLIIQSLDLLDRPERH